MTKQELLEVLKSYTELSYDWDGEGGDPPSSMAISDAADFIDSLDEQADAKLIEECEPTVYANGSIGFVWPVEGKSICIDYAEFQFHGYKLIAYFMTNNRIRISGSYHY